MCERGECDFVRDIAAPLPMAVIGDMLGVLPEERGMLLEWSDDLVTGLSSHIDENSAQAMMEAFAGYTAFTMDIIAKRRAEPTDDLFSILVNAEVEGQRMTDDEIVMETLLILIGGDETTRHTLVRWHRAAAAPPRSVGASGRRSRRAAARRDRGDAAVDVAGEEHVPHADRRHRRSTAPSMRKGEKIMLMFESANFDEAVFGDPGELPHRPQTRTATWPSASARTSASATSWPAWSCR